MNIKLIWLEKREGGLIPKLNVLLIIIFLIGVILRVQGINKTAIWFDESITIYMARMPLLNMIKTTQLGFNPPLWEIIVWANFKIFGESIFSLRLPSLVSSIASMWVVLKILSHFEFSYWTKVAVIFFVALIPYNLWLAQDGRVYSLLSLLYLTAFWFTLQKRWLGVISSVGLILYAHTFGSFFVSAIYLIAIFQDPTNWKKITLLFSVSLITFIPWLFVIVNLTSSNSSLPPMTTLSILDSLSSIYFAKTIPSPYGLFIIPLILSTIVIGIASILVNFASFILKTGVRNLFRHEKHIQDLNLRFAQLSILSLFPFFIMVSIGLFWKNLIYYRPLSPLVIPSIFWMVYLFFLYSRKIIQLTILISWLFFTLIGLLNWNPTVKGGGIDNIATYIKTHWQEGDIIYHATATTYLPFSHYLSSKPTFLLNENLPESLLSNDLQKAFGLNKISIESIAYERIWIIYAIDPDLTTKAKYRMDELLTNAKFIQEISVWHFSPIQVWIKQK